MTVPFMLFLVPPFLLILWLHRSWPAESRRSQTILFLSGFRRPAAGGEAYEKSSRFPGAAKEPDRPHGTKNRCSSERMGEFTTKSVSQCQDQVSSRRNTPGILGIWTV